MSNLEELGSIAPRDVWEGVRARIVGGQRVDMAVVELEPNGLVPEHQHTNEQLGIVIQGSVTFRIADEERELGPGGTWRIPPDVAHAVRAGDEGAVVVDVFTPPRDDWAALESSSPCSPRWPA